MTRELLRANLPTVVDYKAGLSHSIILIINLNASIVRSLSIQNHTSKTFSYKTPLNNTNDSATMTSKREAIYGPRPIPEEPVAKASNCPIYGNIIVLISQRYKSKCVYSTFTWYARTG